MFPPMNRPGRSVASGAAVITALFGDFASEGARADDVASEMPAPRATVAAIQPSQELQSFLDGTVDELLARDASLRTQRLRVSLLDLPTDGAPRLAHREGDVPVYPASVVKFVYLMAAYAWRDQGRLEIDSALDRQLNAMIHVSSNRATQHVLRRLTDTQPGPRLEPEAYAEFVERRHRVKDWLNELGVRDLHTVHPTYDGGGDLYGRDLQFLQDREITGSCAAAVR